MSNLIITIIAIALGAAVVLASMYSGGSAMTQGAAKSAATGVLNQAQQISGGATMFANDHGGTSIAALADLTTGNYLKAIPVPPSGLLSTGPAVWALGTNEVNIAADGKEICLQIEKQRNSGVVAIPTAKPSPAAFGCFGAGPYTVFYGL